MGALTVKKKKLEEQRDKITKELVGFQYQTTTPNEDATQRTNRQKQLQDRIISLEEQIEQVRGEQQILIEAINIANPDGDAITVEELDIQQEAVDKLRGTVETIKNTNPQRYAILTNLFNEYEKAIRYARSYDSTTRKLVSPQTSINEISGWVSKLTSKLKKANGDTEQFFAQLVEDYANNEEKIKVEANNLATREVTSVGQQEWQTFTNTGEVSQERLQAIANKISEFGMQDLSAKEEASTFIFSSLFA